MILTLDDPVLQFTLLVTAALAMQLTVERVHLPGLLGLLALGLVLGPGGTGILPQEPVVSMLGAVGLIYVMFIAGLEIDLRIVREHRGEVVMFGLLAFWLTAAPATAVGLLLLGFGPAAAILLGALISSHTLLAYPILLRLDLLRRLSVVAAVGGTLLTDTLALLALAIVLGVRGSEGGVMQALVPLGLLALLCVAALTGLPRLSRALFARDDISRPEKALFALAALMLLAVGAELIGTHEILGAFLAGICLNRPLAEREELRSNLEFVGRMLFIPFFFIWTGTLLEFEVLFGRSSVWLLAAVLLLLIVAGKSAAAWISGAVYGYAPHERLLMISLTIPQAAATLAVTLTAREAGLFDAEMVDAVVLVIFMTCLAGPLLTDRIGRRVLAGGPEEARRPPMHAPADEELVE